MQISLRLELVESFITNGVEDTGTVLLLELRDSMERIISARLMSGRVVTLQGAFDEAWHELVTEIKEMDMTGCESD